MRAPVFSVLFKYICARRAIFRSADFGLLLDDSGKIHIDIFAGQEGAAFIAGKSTLLATALHELSHFIHDWSPKAWNDMYNYVVDRYSRYDSVQAAIERIKERALLDGETIDDEVAKDEFLAECCEALFNDEAGIRDFAAKHKSTAQKIVDWLNGILEKFAGLDLGHSESMTAAVVAKWEEGLEEFRDRFAAALDDAAKNKNAAEGVLQSNAKAEENNRKSRSNRSVNSELKFSQETAEYSDYDKPITVSDVEELRSIGRKSINSFTSEDIQKSAKWAHKFYKELGTKSPFFRAWFGDWRAKDNTNKIAYVEHEGDSRGEKINKDTGWSINRSAKISREIHNSVASISGRYYLKYIDELIRNSILLDTKISNNDNQNSVFFHSLYGVVKENGHNTVVKLIVEEQEIPVKGDIKRAYKLIDIEKHQPGVKGSGAALTSSLTADDITTVSDLYSFVKRFDKDFTAAHEVNPALLNEDGTPKVFYHGAKKNGGFTVFRNWQYFTDKKSYAERYAERGNSKALYAVYLTADKVFDTRDAQARDIYNSIRSEYGLSELQDTGLPDWTDGYDISEYLDEHPELGYDAIILDEGGDLVDGKPVSRGLSIVVKDSSQVKSATDNIGTFDGANGDIRHSRSQRDVPTEQAQKARSEAEEITRKWGLSEKKTETVRLGLTNIYESMGGDTVDLKLLRQQSKSLAEQAARGMTVSDAPEDVVQHISFLRSLGTVSLTEEQQTEAAKLAGTLKKYASSISSALKIKDGGITLDEAWQSLSEEMPELFPADAAESDRVQILQQNALRFLADE